MHLLIFEHIQNAYYSLRSTKMRTFLTILGVAIGIASITTILSLSGGVTKLVADQVQDLGGNIAVVRPGVINKNLNDFANPASSGMFTTSTLTETDLHDIEKIDGVKAAAPLMILSGSLHSSSDKNIVTTGTVVATTPQLENTTNLPIQDGQFIDTVTNENTAVIGSQLSIDIFGTNQSIGQTFVFRGETFTVIGVLKHLNNPINYNVIDFDRSVIINFTSGKGFNQGIAQIQQININAESVDKLPQVIKAVDAQLSKNHQHETDFTVLSGDEIAKPTSQFFLAVTTVMTVIAAISLIVGGIGIMNIMLVGVAERTREIGLRKAVGASNGNIVSQFMTEALIMSLLGGLLGYVAGYLIAFAISTLLPFDPIINWEIAGIALAIAAIIGGIFGLYPAIRAAQKDPIESLRRYH
jgi:ABC-type antimicrobial peptide transport system permease subunit